MTLVRLSFTEALAGEQSGRRHVSLPGNLHDHGGRDSGVSLSAGLEPVPTGPGALQPARGTRSAAKLGPPGRAAVTVRVMRLLPRDNRITLCTRTPV